MPHVQVRDVPDDVHRTLTQRAEAAGQSLQQYLTDQLAAIARRKTLDEILDEIDASADSRLKSDEIVAMVHAGRAGR